MLGQGMTYGINGGFGVPEKFTINFSKANTTFCWVCIMMVIIVICLLVEKKSLSLKPIMEMSIFHLIFV